MPFGCAALALRVATGVVVVMVAAVSTCNGYNCVSFSAFSLNYAGRHDACMCVLMNPCQMLVLL